MYRRISRGPCFDMTSADLPQSRSIWMRLKLHIAAMIFSLGAMRVSAQTPTQASAPPSQIWTWEQVKENFRLNNTTLMAARLNIDELKAEEVTAHLRPNPELSISADGTQIAPSRGV